MFNFCIKNHKKVFTKWLLWFFIDDLLIMKTVLQKIFACVFAVLLSPGPELLGQTLVNRERYEDGVVVFESLEHYEGGVLQYSSGWLCIKPVMTRDIEGREVELKPARVAEWVMGLGDYAYSKNTHEILELEEGGQRYGKVPLQVIEESPDFSSMHDVFVKKATEGIWSGSYGNAGGIGGIGGFVDGIMGAAERSWQMQDIARSCIKGVDAKLTPVVNAVNQLRVDYTTAKQAVGEEAISESYLAALNKQMDVGIQLSSGIKLAHDLAVKMEPGVTIYPLAYYCCPRDLCWPDFRRKNSNDFNAINGELEELKTKLLVANQALASAAEELKTQMEDIELERELLNLRLRDFQYSAFNRGEALLKAQFLRKDLAQLREDLEVMKGRAAKYKLGAIENAFDEKAEELGEMADFLKTYVDLHTQVGEKIEIDEGMRPLLGLMGPTVGFELEGQVDMGAFEGAMDGFNGVFEAGVEADFERFEDLFDNYLGGEKNELDVKPTKFSPGRGYWKGLEKKLYLYQLDDLDTGVRMKVGLAENVKGDGPMVVRNFSYDASQDIYTVAYEGAAKNRMMVEMNGEGLEHCYRLQAANRGRHVDEEMEAAMAESFEYLMKEGGVASGRFSSETAGKILSVVVDCMPFLGVAKGFVELGTGIDPVTMLEIGRFEAAMGLGFSVVPIPGSKAAGKLVGKGITKVGAVTHKGAIAAGKGAVRLGKVARKEFEKEFMRLTGVSANDVAKMAVDEMMAFFTKEKMMALFSKEKLLETGDTLLFGMSRFLTRKIKGVLGELAAKKTMERAGYKSLPCKLKSNNGFDGVYVKYKDGTDDVIDTIIVESKASWNGRAKFGNTKTMGKQMSNQWIRENIEKMKSSDDPLVKETGKFLLDNLSKVRKKVNVLDAEGANRWNKLVPPL